MWLLFYCQDTGGTPDEGGGDRKERDENGVEMDDNFEGEIEDVPQQEEEREEKYETFLIFFSVLLCSFNNEEDEELDKKMGQFGDDGNTEEREQLDRNMWAPEDDKQEENDDVRERNMISINVFLCYRVTKSLEVVQH